MTKNYITFLVLTMIFFSLPLYAADLEPFQYKEVTYKFDTRYPERTMTLKDDLDGDGKIETVIGFQGVTSDSIAGLSFVALGREVNGKFTPEVFVSGNDRFDNIEFKDVDGDKVNEIVFWSSGGMHFVSLDIYKMTNTGLKVLLRKGSAAGVDIEGDSFPYKIKVGKEKWEEPDWSYTKGTDRFEVYEWDGKEFKRK
jgi:hypothetical protein